MKTIQMNQANTTIQVGAGMGTTEGACRATGVVPMPGGAAPLICSSPDPEVFEKKPRRNFTANYKLRILQQVELCTKPGQIGALLRREGLYSSNLSAWRKQREKGLLQAMTSKKRGRKCKGKNPLAKRVAQLEKENRRLQEKLKKAETIIEVQKKMSEILGINQAPDDNQRSTS